MYWEKELETLNRPDLEKLQVERLNKTLAQASKSSFYSKTIKGKTLSSIQEVQDLPFTTKQDLRDNFPYGFLSVDQREVVRLHSSSGTTGNPTVIFHTKADLASWANLMARCLYAAGIRDKDVFQNMSGYGLFTGGLGFQYGIEALGCLSIPSGAGNSLRQIKLMQDYGTTVAHAIPSYLKRLYDVFMESGLDPKTDTKLHSLMIGAEPHTDEQRRRIEDMFGVKAYNSFGLSEMNGPGVAFECIYQDGMHVWEDAYLVEIIDPDTLEPVPDGEFGELVMTTLDRTAMPLVRYRTRDLTRFLPGQCQCGRTHRRLDRITGRSDDMIIVKGCNIFPMQIEGILMKFKEISSEYLITLDTMSDNDVMTVEVELDSEKFVADINFLANLTGRITQQLRDEILIKPVVRLVRPGSIPKGEGKAVRVVDNRIKS